MKKVSLLSRNMFRKWYLSLPIFLFLLDAHAASAHTGAGAVGGFLGGFEHPLSGLDHIVAMVSVGLWGAFLGAPAIYLLPITFPLVMTVGGVMGVLGIPLPGVEVGIALSGIVLGAMVLFKVKPKIWIAAVIVGIFALFHGHAHGAELPHAANAVTYSIGFVLATGLLHLSGIAIGLLKRWKYGEYFIQVLGALVMLVGFGFLFHIL